MANIQNEKESRRKQKQWFHILARMNCNRNSDSLLVSIQNGTVTSEDSLAVAY
jgi:hypothetical protein